MRLQKQFDVSQPPDVAARIAARDDTLEQLFSESKTEIVERSGNRRTTRTHYRALGKQGVATFRFHSMPDGSIGFEKVCDGNVWRDLSGKVTFSKRGAGSRVTLDMTGRTKALVPELAIRGPMREQIDQMASALLACIEAGEDGGAASRGGSR
jgi:hypothetical protein